MASINTDNGIFREAHQHQMRRQNQRRKPSQGVGALSFSGYHTDCVGKEIEEGKVQFTSSEINACK